MSASALEASMIQQPELWRLTMLLRDDSIEVAIIPPVESEDVIYRSLMFDPGRPVLRSLEDIIYGNPLLLSDFKRVECIIDTDASLIAPAEVSPADYELLLQHATGTDADAMVVNASPTGTDTAVALSSLEADTRAFLTRTFFNIRFDSSIAVLCRHFASMNPDAATGHAIMVAFRSGRIDIVALEQGRLLTANTIVTGNDSDSAFFIAATFHEFGIPADTPVLCCGDFATAGRVAELLQPDGIVFNDMTLPPLRFRASQAALQMPPQLLFNSLT